MSGLRPIIESAIGAAIAEHPKYFTERGLEKAQTAITRKIMAALVPRGGADDVVEQPAPLEPAEVVRRDVDPKSPEGRAYTNLRSLAGASPPFKMAAGAISLPPEAQTPAVYALADLPALPWLFITDRSKIGAWLEFLAASLPIGTARKPIQFEQGGTTGILMPWPWPPSVTGKVYAPDEAASA